MFSKSFLIDAAERAASTAIQAFLATLVAAGTMINVSVLQAAVLSALAAGLSGAKSILATQIGDPESASLLDTPAPAPGGLSE